MKSARPQVIYGAATRLRCIDFFGTILRRLFLVHIVKYLWEPPAARAAREKIGPNTATICHSRGRMIALALDDLA